jgi:two-component system, NarL family, nitrate/nitrite response regulator NarL
MKKIRVLIVDDHPIIRKGIFDIISQATDMKIIAETGNGDEAFRLAQALKPDVILLDMEIEGMSGLHVAQNLHKEGSPARILALSAHTDQEYVQELLQSGAAGYLSKDELPDMILSAVRSVARGETGWVSRHILASFSEWSKASETQSATEMTKRERQVLAHVIDGKTNQKIGQLLSISEKTVEKHLESIFRKLGVTSRTEAAVWATRQDIQQNNKLAAA